MRWWINDFLSFCWEVLLPMGIIMAILGLLLGVCIAGDLYYIERPSCFAHWRDSGLYVRWSVFGDCQVSSDGKYWVTDDAFININKHVAVQR